MKTEPNEINIRIEIDEMTEQLRKTIRQVPYEQVAHKIIKTFLSVENPGPELHGRFVGWLTDPHNGAAKEKALERCFYESLNENEGIHPARVEPQCAETVES